MCGIAGIVYKNGAGATGDALLKMLHGCQHRGRDSTGLALYGPMREEQIILRVFLDADLCHESSQWSQRKSEILRVLAQHHFQTESESSQKAFMRVAGHFDSSDAEPDIQKLSYAVEDIAGVEIFSAGHSLEVIKDEGTADDLENRDAFRSHQVINLRVGQHAGAIRSRGLLTGMRNLIIDSEDPPLRERSVTFASRPQRATITPRSGR